MSRAVDLCTVIMTIESAIVVDAGCVTNRGGAVDVVSQSSLS